MEVKIKLNDMKYRYDLYRRFEIYFPLDEIKFLDDDFEDTITLVTTLDAKPEDMLISIESDLGKALVGKKAGDIAEVMAPGENYKVEILEIL